MCLRHEFKAGGAAKKMLTFGSVTDVPPSGITS